MKKNVKMRYGFTVAELLISMLIVMMVATALVPVIGPKKVSGTDPRHLHGIAECYYSGNSLMYYYADNRTNRDALEVPQQGNSCPFDIPKATRYEIFAIGAGSDGAGNDDAGLSEEIIYDISQSGSITIENFSNDINSVRVNGESFANEVRESFTRWADRINHNRGIVGNHMEDDGTDPIENYRANGDYLYAEFRGIRGPIGSPGAGHSKIHLLTGKYTSSGDKCDDIYNYNRNNLILRDKPNGGYWMNSNRSGRPSDEIQATNSADGTDACAFILHNKGGDAAAPAEIANVNTPVLFPIDGSSNPILRDGAPLRVNPDNPLDPGEAGDLTYLTIQIGCRGINNPLLRRDNRIQLNSSAPGNNGFADPSPTIQGIDGANGDNDNLAFEGGRIDVRNGENTVSIRYGNEVLRDNHFRIRENSYEAEREGMEHGREDDAGFSFPNPRGHRGNLGIAVPAENGGAFAWRYAEARANITYKAGGIPGTMKSLSSNNLSGRIFLKPARNQNERTTVSTDENGNNIILSAQSGQFQQQGTTDGNYLLSDAEDPAIPIDSIIKRAIPSNNQFSSYIDKVIGASRYGLRGGLLQQCDQLQPAECKDTIIWPGYAGSGAFPLIVEQNINNYLELENRQPYAANSSQRIYRRTFQQNLNNNNNNPTCPQGMVNPNANNNGTQFCRAQNPGSGRGAVVIVW